MNPSLFGHQTHSCWLLLDGLFNHKLSGPWAPFMPSAQVSPKRSDDELRHLSEELSQVELEKRWMLESSWGYLIGQAEMEIIYDPQGAKECLGGYSF